MSQFDQYEFSASPTFNEAATREAFLLTPSRSRLW